MSTKAELNTITSTLDDLAQRITALVENGASLPADLFTELVAAERSVGTLRRRLQRVAHKVAP